MARGAHHVLLTTAEVNYAVFPSLGAGLFLLALSLYTLPVTEKSWPKYTRLTLTPLALYAFWDFGFGHDVHYGAIVRENFSGYATISLYGIMRVIETNVISLFDDNEPQKWVDVHTNTVMGLPQTVRGRIAYALDALTSMRGASWIYGRRWNFCSSRIARHTVNPPHRLAFILHNVVKFFILLVTVDIIDTYIKSVSFSLTSPTPVSSHPSLSTQLLCAVAICIWTYLGVELQYAALSAIFVATRLTTPAAWPPFFHSPLFASSIADFWGVRWHAMFRRCFDRLSSPFIARGSTARRLTWAFVCSTILHLIVMHATPPTPKYPYDKFVDPGTLQVIRCGSSE